MCATHRPLARAGGPTDDPSRRGGAPGGRRPGTAAPPAASAPGRAEPWDGHRARERRRRTDAHPSTDADTPPEDALRCGRSAAHGLWWPWPPAFAAARCRGAAAPRALLPWRAAARGGRGGPEIL